MANKLDTPETAPGADLRDGASKESRSEAPSGSDAVAILLEQQAEILKRVDELGSRQADQSLARPRKDIFDVVAAFAPILSGAIIALGGAYFTTIYNQQQLKLQEIQTIEKFIPHLMGDEKSKKAAILAISSLTDAKLASKIASIYASKGTVSALEQIVQQSSQGDRKVASTALAKALDTMAESYDEEKRSDEAIAAFKKALQVREQTYGATSPMLVSSLNRLARLYQAHGDSPLAESLLKRARDIQKKNYGQQSAQYLAALKQLQQLYSDAGDSADSQTLQQEITSTAAQLKASGKSQDTDSLPPDELSEPAPQPDATGPDAGQDVSPDPSALTQPLPEPARTDLKTGDTDRLLDRKDPGKTIPQDRSRIESPKLPPQDRLRTDLPRTTSLERTRSDAAHTSDSEPQPGTAEHQ